MIVSFELKGLDVASWIVWTLLGSKIFVFQFTASPDKFDTVFPISEKMLNYIKILDYQNNSVTQDNEDDE